MEQAAVKRNRFPMYLRILLAMVAGAIVGLLAGKSAAPLGEIGKVLITLIKTLAVPLLLFAVLDAFLRTQLRSRSFGFMIGISLFNAALATVIGLTISNVLQPGKHLQMDAIQESAKLDAAKSMGEKVESINFIKTLTEYIPTSIVQPFVDNAIVSVILLAVLIGAALRTVKNVQIANDERSYETVESAIATLYQTAEVMIGWVVSLVPLAVFGVVAKTVGETGFASVRGLAAYVGVAVLGLLIHILFVYQAWIIFVARMPLRQFWGGAREAIIYALGASSSLATLPVTLRCLERMKVSPQSSRLAACVGTNLNNDGILLYEAMAVLFVAQVYGIDLTLGQQIVAALCCVIAGIGIAGVPDAGLISLSLVLATVGLPVELLPLLLTVDWILSRCRAMTNVISDIVVAVLLDRFGGAADEGELDKSPVIDKIPAPAEA
jgi:DAACS family dicarboxylate/amino acid:cation (Na+ or H+) symporter